MIMGRRIWPAQRIVEKIDLADMIKRHGMKVPLEFRNEHGQELAISSHIYTFNSNGLREFVDELVELTMDETLQVLRRKVMQSEWVEGNE